MRQQWRRRGRRNIERLLLRSFRNHLLDVGTNIDPGRNRGRSITTEERREFLKIVQIEINMIVYSKASTDSKVLSHAFTKDLTWTQKLRLENNKNIAKTFMNRGE